MMLMQELKLWVRINLRNQRNIPWQRPLPERFLVTDYDSIRLQAIVYLNYLVHSNLKFYFW